MPYLKIIIAFTLYSDLACAQDFAARIQQLQQENDSLRLALYKCQAAPFQLLADFNPTTAINSTEILQNQQELLLKIKQISQDKYKIALRVVDETSAFVTFCEGLRGQLLQLTIAWDSTSQSPMGLRNKVVTNTFLVEGDQGIVLKNRILSLRSRYLDALSGASNPMIPLDIEADYRSSSADQKWVQYKFKNMPVAAVLPILGKYMADAESSAQAVLLYLSQE